MINKNTVIQLAKSQIGYFEKASNDMLDDFTENRGSANWTKYARDLDAIEGFYNGKKNGPWGEWCDIFVDWCFVRAYGVVIGLQLLCQPVRSAGAGCQYSAQYYQQQGRFFATGAEPGDQIFFDYGSGIAHTGIVVDVNDFAIITVEGNADNQVKRNSYPHSCSYIAGFGRPNWAMYGEPDAPAFDDDETDGPAEPDQDAVEVTASLPVIRFGDVSMYVKIMQVLLIGKGFSCGQYGADGDYGTQTKIGLFQFQQAKGLETDCVCSRSTWEALLTI